MGTSESTVKLDVATTRQDNTINVACYNVYFKGFDRKGTIDTICDMKVDILILQECNDNWERVITQNNIIKSKFKYIKCVNDKWGEGGTILLTNYRIKTTDVIDRYHQWWYGAHRFTLCLREKHKKKHQNVLGDDDKDDDDNKEILLQLYSIHLIAPYPPMNGTKCCCCYCFGDSKNVYRCSEIQHFLNDKYYNRLLPTIVLGDFNCMDGQCHDILGTSYGLKSIWQNRKRHNYLLCCKHKPFSWRGMLCQLCCCAPKLFDHIYYSQKDFNLIHSDVIKKGESDHYPIWAMLVTKF